MSLKVVRPRSKFENNIQLRTTFGQTLNELLNLGIKMASKSEDAKQDTTRELDCSNAGRGVWLVKVPKYIAKKWLKGKVSRIHEILSAFHKFRIVIH